MNAIATIPSIQDTLRARYREARERLSPSQPPAPIIRSRPFRPSSVRLRAFLEPDFIPVFLPKRPIPPRAAQRRRDWLVFDRKAFLATIADDATALQNLTVRPAAWMIIIEEVAAKHGLKPADLRCKSQERRLVDARHEAMHRMKVEASMNFSEIGRRLGDRHASTVRHGIHCYAATIAAGAA